MFAIKLKDEYLTGACDDQGRHIMTNELSFAYLFTKEKAEIVKSGDARLKEAQLVCVEQAKK